MTSVDIPTIGANNLPMPGVTFDLEGRDATWRAADYAIFEQSYLAAKWPAWLHGQASPFAPDAEITDRLVVMTAGNATFRSIILRQLQNLECLGIRAIVYDLGGLGIGLPRPVENAAFHRDGRYGRLDNGWPSKGLHKPAIISDALARMKDERSVLLYLDGDAIPISDLGQLTDPDFDIAVIRRPESERKAAGHQYSAEMGQINAGVLAFRPTAFTAAFIERWISMMNHCGGDQLALNKLLPKKLVDGETRVEGGLKWHVLPPTCNVSYPPAQAQNNLAIARIIHIKSQNWRRLMVDHPFYEALFIPDYTRQILTHQCPEAKGISRKISPMILANDGIVIVNRDLPTLISHDWQLQRVYADPHCAWAFWLGPKPTVA